jgi:hypothetical protein
MVKRAKLTLDHKGDADITEEELQDAHTETKKHTTRTRVQPPSILVKNIGKILLIAGLTIATIAILRRKSP